MVSAIMQFEPVTVCAPDVSKVRQEQVLISRLDSFALTTLCKALISGALALCVPHA